MKKQKGVNLPASVRQERVSKANLKEPFLAALKQTIYVTQACDRVGISRSTVYDEWRQKDPAFRQKMDDIDAGSLDLMRSEAFRRAVVGNEEPTSVGGQIVKVRRYSDYLLDRLLRSKDPAFKDNLRVDVHLNFVTMLVVRLQSIIQRVIPISCPHCHKTLPTRQDMSRELGALGTMDVTAVSEAVQ